LTRFLEFFANSHTRRGYARAAEEFLAWCAEAGPAFISRERVAACAPIQAVRQC